MAADNIALEWAQTFVGASDDEGIEQASTTHLLSTSTALLPLLWRSSWFLPVASYLVAQAIFGILAFEWAWKKTRRFREVSKEEFRDARLQEIHRQDAQKWARWKLYPGAMFLLLPRLLLLFVNALALVLVFKILLIGYDVKKQGLPIKRGCRQRLIKFFGNLHSMLMLFFAGMYSYSTKKDVDYSYYLGPDYKSTMSKKVPSTVIANHVSFLDAIVFSRRIVPSFAPMESLSRVPMVSTMCNAVGSLYMPRGGTREIKDLTLSLMKERQELVQEGNGDYPPLMIFPEGTTSNGKLLFQFKKGAFLAEKTIRPYTLTYSSGTVHPAWENIDFLPFIIFFLSWPCYTCRLQELPDFEPNEYLFETHKDKGQSRWEVYAWAVREVMLEHGQLTSSTVPYKVKNAYVGYVNMHPGAIHPDELNEETAPPEMLKSQKSMRFLREASALQKSKSLLQDNDPQLLSLKQKALFKSHVQAPRESLLQKD